jgi:hypothetical protein
MENSVGLFGDPWFSVLTLVGAASALYLLWLVLPKNRVRRRLLRDRYRQRREYWGYE